MVQHCLVQTCPSILRVLCSFCLPEIIYLAMTSALHAINSDDLFCIHCLVICVLLDSCTAKEGSAFFLSRNLYIATTHPFFYLLKFTYGNRCGTKKNEQLNHEFNTKLMAKLKR
jgi:hypothetical protein